MGLLRYQLFLVIGVGFMSIWYALVKQQELQQQNDSNKETTTTTTTTNNQISSVLILYAPIWAILSLGVYAVLSIGYGLMNFKDTPEAAKELDKEIIEAKTEMKRRGILK
jgi:dolichyl-phosphate mannosyltransferase polypeptide 3